MKHKQSTRQLSALGRLLNDVKHYQKWIKHPPENSTSEDWTKKLAKAEKCIDNLKAKGITG